VEKGEVRAGRREDSEEKERGEEISHPRSFLTSRRLWPLPR